MLFSFPRFSAACLSLLPLFALAAPSPVHAQKAKASPPGKKDLVRAIDDTPRADAEVTKRAALVIGNTNYEYKPLKNPLNDARDMAAALTKLGFKVTLKYDLTLIQMRETANAWADSLDSHTLALVYYSGHGVTNEGQNYFVPVNNAGITHKRDVPDLAYPFTRLLESTKEAGCPLRIFILDACRNDPLPRGLRGGDEAGGLTKVNAPTGAFIAYAAGFGETASDNGDGQNGLYTSVLLKNIATPGLPIESLFKRVRGAVQKESGGEQHPDESSQLIGDFSFVDAVTPPPVNNVIPVTPKPAPNNPKPAPPVVKPAPVTPQPMPIDDLNPAPKPNKRPLGKDAIVLKDAKIAFAPIPGDVWEVMDRSEWPPQFAQSPQMVLLYLGDVNDENTPSQFTTNIILQVAPNTANEKVSVAAVENLSSVAAGQMSEYKKMEIKAFSIAAETAVSYSYTFSVGGAGRYTKQVLVGHGGKIYNFIFTAPAALYSKQVAPFDKLVESIEWR